jgi:hypothetical protein
MDTFPTVATTSVGPCSRFGCWALDEHATTISTDAASNARTNFNVMLKV